jgi:dTDP-glucose 4,6-dehydratase
MGPIPVRQLDEVLLPWAQAWTALRGRRVFLSGGTGTIGAWLLELFCRANQLWALGARIQVLSRNPAAFRARCPHLAGDPAVSFLVGDIRDFQPLAEPVHCAIHAAAASSGPQAYSDLLGQLDTLVLGTRHLLERMVEAGAGRVLLLSSGAVYGPQPPGLEQIPEDFPGAPDGLDPGTRYAQGKRMAEHYCALFRHQFGLETLIARGFALVGPHLPLDAHFALGNFIRDALAGGPIQVLGDGTPFRSYLYASDYAMACWLILLAGEPGRAYNVGSSEAIQLEALARMIARPLGQAVVIHQSTRPGSPPARYVPSDQRLREELGFRPRVDLGEAIQRTMDWYRS